MTAPQPPPDPFTLQAGEVHVWRVELDPSAEILDALRRTLGPDELRRADRYRADRHRQWFTAGRGFLRAVLGGYLGQGPDSVAFAYGTYGKPELATESSGLRFNLAHTHSLGLCALTIGRAVGVDVERVRAMTEAERIIGRYFSAAEQAEFLALPDPERLAAFFRGWARKEAYLKAIGTGLATQLDAFDVTLGPDRPAELLRVGDDPAEAGRWSLHDLDAGPGYAAALAAAGPVSRVVMRRWVWAEEIKGSRAFSSPEGRAGPPHS